MLGSGAYWPLTDGTSPQFQGLSGGKRRGSEPTAPTKGQTRCVVDGVRELGFDGLEDGWIGDDHHSRLRPRSPRSTLLSG